MTRMKQLKQAVPFVKMKLVAEEKAVEEIEENEGEES